MSCITCGAPDRIEQAIYLDHNATTPILPEVVDAMLPTWSPSAAFPPRRTLFTVVNHESTRPVDAVFARRRGEERAMLRAEPS